MGGNAKAIDRKTGNVKVFNGKEAYANKVDLREISPDALLHLVDTALFELDKRMHLWPSALHLANGKYYNGSAANICPPRPKEEIIQHKPIIGDIDVMVPVDRLFQLFNELALLEGLKIGELIYVGQNRSSLRGEQISSVWHHEKVGFIQVDFEGVNFIGDEPDPFAKFAHSSPWVDVKQGLKGVAHKYMLMTLAWVMRPISNAVILTEKSPLWPIEKVRRKTLHQPPRAMSFSVDRGLRHRLQVQRVHGVTLKLPDGVAFKEIPTDESDYITDLDEIFTEIFMLKPMEGDIERMSSFTGLIELCKLHLAPWQVRELFDQLVRYKLFGSGQALSRDSAEEDRQVKFRIIEHLMKEFPYLRDAKTPVADLMIEYYDKYRERSVSD